MVLNCFVLLLFMLKKTKNKKRREIYHNINGVCLFLHKVNKLCNLKTVNNEDILETFRTFYYISKFYLLRNIASNYRKVGTSKIVEIFARFATVIT